MAFSHLGLFDLLAPEYLAGFDFPEYVHRYLSILGIDELHTHEGSGSVVYNGICSFTGDGSGAPEMTHADPSGTQLTFPMNRIRFRLSIPRDGAAFIRTEANSSTSDKLPQVALLLNDLFEASTLEPLSPTDLPGTKFTLQLFINNVRFSLGTDWVAGEFDAALHKVVTHTDPRLAGKPVEMVMPGLAFTFSQGDDPSNMNLKFTLDSFGSNSLDAPNDLGMGEVIRMEPGIALHTSGHVAFSVEQILLDTSQDATPPEILEHFGIGDDWQGIYIKQLLFYYNNDQSLGFAVRLADALFGFDGKVSFEAELDIYPNPDTTSLVVTPFYFHGSAKVDPVHRGIVDPEPAALPADPPGLVRLTQGDAMQLDISRGVPPFQIEVLEGAVNLWDTTNRRVIFNTPGTHNLVIKVTDNKVPDHQKFREYIQVVVAALVAPVPASGSPADSGATPRPLPLIHYNQTGNDTIYALEKISGEENPARFKVVGGNNFTIEITQTAGGTAAVRTISNEREFSIDVQPGTTYTIGLTFSAIDPSTPSETRYVQFKYDRPLNSEVSTYVMHGSGDTEFESSFSSLPNHPVSALTGIVLDGYASNDPSNPAHDIELSHNRAQTVYQLLQSGYTSSILPAPGAPNYHGHSGLPFSPDSEPRNRCVRVVYTFATTPSHLVTGTLSRDPYPPVTTPTPPTPRETPAAPPHLRGIPPAFKLLGVRVKIDNNQLSLLEIYCKVDFETDIEKKLREAPDSDPGGTLDMSHEGVVDFKIGYIYDRASQETTISLLVHTEEGDTSGILNFENNANRDDRLKNIAGALLLFAPIMNASASSLVANKDDVGAWIGLVASFGTAVLIGGLNVFRTRKVVLYGIEGKFKWIRPDSGLPGRWDLGCILDYGIEFDIIVDALGIGQDRKPSAPLPLPRPLKARYRAIGFNIVRGVDGSAQYQSIFDTSKGYELDLSDPSLFRLPAPLGTLFNIVGARVARFNPVTFEVDFAIKVDLGVITVDRFKLKIPLDPVGPPQIIPSGVRVNIPGVIVGNGFVNIVDADVVQPDGTTIHSKGVEGGLDLTLVSLKLRIAGNVAFGSIKDTVSGREAIAVFVGLIVEFPTPIILGQSGMGLYGLSGLFAMHYRRIEDPRQPTDAVGPALKWLIKAGGEAQKLYNGGIKLWEPQFDRWSFGVGAVLGTIEGGTLVNLQGMFVLELPGPRILIMIKMRLITLKPKVNTDPAQMELGMIGVIDLDFQQMQLTVGVMVNFEIKELLQIAIPIELYFKLDNPSNWHLYLGTISQPASAKILNIVRGSAYFMIQGSNLVYATYGSAVPAFLQDKTLNAVAIATGIEASILLGDPGSVYLKIAAAAHLGVSFSPFLIVGNLHFEGTLRLVVISIGAHGDFNVMVNQLPDKSFNTYLRGEVCGEVDFFFFSISACISLEIGSEDHTIIPPKLVRGIYLQSYSPVLVSGQASNQRPIDASLGNAKEVEHGEATPVDGFPIVPIDSVIVLQLQAAPEIAINLNTLTFTEDVLVAPGRPSGGWYQLSEDVQVQYVINSLSLSENGAVYSGTRPPATWRLDRPHQPNGADTAIDLALFSRVPTAAEFAMERSTDLKKSVTVRWENACKPAAPPTRVMYSFCNQPLGASRHGWKIRGIALPDPPDTIRSEPPKTLISVYGPDCCGTQNPFDLLLAEYGYPYSETAEIVGVNNLTISANGTIGSYTHMDFASHQVNLDTAPLSDLRTKQDFKKCYDLTALKKGYQRNPMILENEIEIYSSATKKGIYSKTRGFLSENVFLQSKQLKTRIRLLQDVKGISVREFMRIDVLGAPVQEVSVEFISYSNKPRTVLTVYAYNEQMKLVAHQKWTPATDQKTEHGQVDIRALNIKYLLIASRYYVGILTRICLSRKITPVIDSCGNCYRALQLPWENKRTQQLQDNRNQPDVELVRNYLDKKPCCRYITIETGACEEISLFGAVYSKFTNQIQVEELDENNTILASYLLSDLAPKVITQPATELPKSWLEPDLPWRKCTIPVLMFMYSDQFRIYDKILITLRPVKGEACKRIRFNTCEVHTNMPAMYLALTDLLTSGEVQHQQTITEIQQTDKKTLDDYVNNNTPRVLMKPDQVYRLNVNYSVKIKSTGQPDNTQSFDQDFVFKTDNKAPAELNSYVLGTTPEMDEHFHFYGEELAVVFNDPEILRLYEAYGKHLRAVIRGADGAQVINSPDELHTLEEIPAEVNSPYREYVEELLQSGALPCIGGVVNFKQHGIYKAPYKLKPLMPYTLDIEFIEADPVVSDQAKTPLYRRAFTTSRFEDLKEFAQTHKSFAVKHRALISDLSGLPDLVGGIDPVVSATDKEIEQALINAGVPFSQDDEKSGFTILWRQTGSLWRPCAMVIDASEPTWKKRIEPMPKQMVGSDNTVIDPAFVIYEKQEKDHLLLKSVAGEDLVKGFIRSTGGTRTVVVFKDGLIIPASGSLCTIQIQRPSSSLYGLSAKTETLIQINLLPKAPWED